MGPKSNMTGVLMENLDRDKVQTPAERRLCKDGDRDGVMQPQLRLPGATEAGRDRGGSSPGAFRGNVAQLTL